MPDPDEVIATLQLWHILAVGYGSKVPFKGDRRGWLKWTPYMKHRGVSGHLAVQKCDYSCGCWEKAAATAET